MPQPNARSAVLALVMMMATASCSSSDSPEAETGSDSTGPAATVTTEDAATSDVDLVVGVSTTDGLWSDGMINLRNGEPLVFVGGEHLLANVEVETGHNVVVDHDGAEIDPSGRPFEGGETLIHTDEEQTEANVAAYAEVLSYIGPIRDAILYDFETTSADDWDQLTEVLTINGIKTEDAPTVDDRAILSSSQVHAYVASGPTGGGAVARYLEEAELELKCLAFDSTFDFTNPEGADHCADHGLIQGSGIRTS